ncbi:2-isopropylmalate synthase [Spelaeicoccus albus]|uniref:2-isopropylmalate synthase n=1 Tax=Spelaeicoccus albus TaxID=1280376 RepID=A0A7Z0II57_9MICO|nr:2-isopropylmalate synthase [Spelaeicoccus albus]NYI68195.1 2-isopropylmalate synthase [Spelaeicoccus albus]
MHHTQQPTPMPVHKYRPFHTRIDADLPDRTWPTKRIEKAPRWLTTDLRDGNQALIDPMTPERKRRMYDLLVSMGYKEIEVGFPAASQVDFDFVRHLVDEDLVPDDVRISVLTQAREDLIERTVQSLEGIKNATVHMYNAAAPVFRKVVFGFDGDGRAECRNIAVQGTQAVMKYASEYLPDSNFGYEYSPEIFMDTEPDFALEIVGAVLDTWGPASDRETVVNLPCTVERSTPNVFADQIEYMSRNMPYRDDVALSVHTHNDRGTAVASAELAVMAGADRVEGCLFGNGERTGNVDLVTLGLNLYSQGVDPQIDFSNIDEVVRTVEYCNQIGVHERHPYGGDLVYTSFSGSHQDAIKKAFDDRERRAVAEGISVDQYEWDMPYLPLDPKDVGRSYEAVIRVNSQSGKGGVSYLLKSEYQLDLPRRLQVEFSQVVQRRTESEGGEVSAATLWQIFSDEYLPSTHSEQPAWGTFALTGVRTESGADDAPRNSETLTVDMSVNGDEHTVTGRGNGPVAAFVNVLSEDFDVDVRVQDYVEHAMGAGGDAQAAAYVECVVGDRVLWGVGLDPNITTATLKAVISAVNRATR